MALALAPIIPRDFGPRNSLGAASWLVLFPVPVLGANLKGCLRKEGSLLARCFCRPFPWF